MKRWLVLGFLLIAVDAICPDIDTGAQLAIAPMIIAALISAAGSMAAAKQKADADSIPGAGKVGGGGDGGNSYAQTQGKDFMAPTTSTPVGGASVGPDKSTEAMARRAGGGAGRNMAFRSGATAGMDSFLPPNVGSGPLSYSTNSELMNSDSSVVGPGTVQQPAPPGPAPALEPTPSAPPLEGGNILDDPNSAGGWSPMKDGSFLQPGSTGDMVNQNPPMAMPDSYGSVAPDAGGGMGGAGYAQMGLGAGQMLGSMFANRGKPPAGAGYGGRGAFNMQNTTPRLGDLMRGQAAQRRF